MLISRQNVDREVGSKEPWEPRKRKGRLFWEEGLFVNKQSYLETVYAASLLPLSGIALISVYFSDTVYLDL